MPVKPSYADRQHRQGPVATRSDMLPRSLHQQTCTDSQTKSQCQAATLAPATRFPQLTPDAANAFDSKAGAAVLHSVVAPVVLLLVAHVLPADVLQLLDFATLLLNPNVPLAQHRLCLAQQWTTDNCCSV